MAADGTIDRALLEALVEQAPDAIIVADREGLIRLWNAAAERLFGHAASDVTGQSLDVIIPEHLRRAHWDGFDAALRSRRTRHEGRPMTTRSMHRDGRKLYVDVSFALLTDATGEVTGVLAIGRDASPQRDAQAALRERIASLEKALAAKSGTP